MNNIDLKVDQMDNGVNQGKNCQENSTCLVVGNMKIQRNVLVDSKFPEESLSLF